MRLSHRSLILFALTAAYAAFVVTACSLPRNGLLEQSCSVDSSCDDGNPCTQGVCTAVGLCEQIPVGDGVLDAQLTGDCLRALCVAGVLEQERETSDVLDDGNTCTSDKCSDSGPTNTVLADDTPCVSEAGLDGRCSMGQCKVDCTPQTVDADCGDGNPCTVESCDAGGSCSYEPLDNVVAPAADQTAGDCKLLVCQLGVAVGVAENTDLPVDGNECTDDVCNNGNPDNPARVIGAPCAQNGGQLCNGNSASPDCVECNQPSDCTALPANDECQQRTCIANQCGQSFTPIDTPLNIQMPGDCKLAVCDGSGGVKQNVTNGDLPVDNNECTSDVCVSGTPSNPPLSPNSACGLNGQLFCDGAGSCEQCLVSSQCGTDTFCQQHLCNVQNVCQVINTPNGTALPPASQITNDCKLKVCNGAGIEAEVPSNGDVPLDDGNQCTDEQCSGGAPIHPPSTMNQACSQMGGQYCDGNSACVECNAPTQCPAAPDCQHATCNSNACGIGNDPLGIAAPLGYQLAGDCHEVVCDGGGMVSPTPAVDDLDLPVDGNECTDDVCTSGTPSNPPEPAETPCTTQTGWVCNGSVSVPACVECATANQCGAGEVCEMTGWMCCAPTSCAALGKTCGAHPSGCGGTIACSGSQNGSETDVDCGGSIAACATRCALGQQCVVGSDCAGGICVDGFCCDSACGAACDGCDVSGLEGTCSPLPPNTSGDPVCAGGFLCDGASTSCPTSCTNDTECESSHFCTGMTCLPKGQIGAPCVGNNECVSSSCADSRCCDSACNTTCESCDALGSEGTCTPYAQGSDPESECAPDVCDGAGQCEPAPVCGDGVVSGGEACDPADPLTPCCAGDCMGVALPGELCGGDPDGAGCQAAPTCDGVTNAPSGCVAASEPDTTPCSDDNLFCTGVEQCSGGMCVGLGDPCLSSVGDGDADCSEVCNDTSDDCSDPDPSGALCDNGGGMNSGMCDGAGICL